MSDLVWGLQMMLVGMGVVFGLLLLLMGVLVIIGRLDRPAVEPDAAASGGGVADAEPDAARAVRITADGLDDDQVAAIAVAVMTHAEIRRRSAAPEARAFAPGSQLFASRWVAIGRSFQQSPFKRR